MIVVSRPTLLLSLAAAARVSCVDCPLTCNTRANARTRSDRSGMERVVTASIPEPWAADSAELSGGRCNIGFHHLARIHNAIEFRLAYKAQLQGGGPERQIIVEGVVSDLGCLVIADDGRESRHQHQRTFDVLIDLLKIGLGTLDQEFAEICDAVGHDRDGMGDIED